MSDRIARLEPSRPIGLDYDRMTHADRAAHLHTIEARLAEISFEIVGDLTSFAVATNAPIRSWASGDRAWLHGQSFRDTPDGRRERQAAMVAWLLGDGAA